jgi:hypothetical protein
LKIRQAAYQDAPSSFHIYSLDENYSSDESSKFVFK